MVSAVFLIDIYMYSRSLSARAFVADFPPAAPEFHQRTHRVRLRNLGTTDKKSSRKIKYKKIPRVHILKTAQNKKICFAPESASKPTNCYAAALLPQF